MMTDKQLSQFLTTKGFRPDQVTELTKKLMNLDASLMPCLENWVAKDNKQDYSVMGYSLYGFMEDFQMKYTAALLSLDWVIKDPEKAIPIIKKGIR